MTEQRSALLAPEPVTPFSDLISLLWREWPQCPPYGGAFAEVVPHVTVAMPGGDSPREAVAALGARLPIRTRAERAELWQRDDAGVWRTAEAFPFAGGEPCA